MTLSPLALYFAQTTLAVSVLTCLVLLMRRPVARRFGAQAAYALWAIPLLRLILPPMPANWTLFGFFQRGNQNPATPIPASSEAEIIHTLQFISGDNFAAATPPTWASPSLLLDMMAPVLFSLWAVGAFCVLVIFYMRQNAFTADMRKGSRPVSPQLLKLASDLRSDLTLNAKHIDLCLNPACEGPAVAGLLRPTIFLPDTFERDYTYEEQRTALTHELMHIKRGDLWGLHLAVIAVAAQWINPLAWVAQKTFRTDQEAACDADVLTLGRTCPQAYGATLIKTARISRLRTRPVLSAHLPLNHALHERLKTMTNPLPSARKRTTGSLLATTIGAAALIASACASSTAQEATGTQKVETIITATDTESVFINDDDGNVSIVLNGKELSPEEIAQYLEANDAGIRTIRIQQGADPTTFHTGRVLYIGDEGNERPDSAAFAKEMRRLAQDPAANSEKMQALAEDFEKRLTAWGKQREAQIEVQTHFIEKRAQAVAGGITWNTDGVEHDCDEGAQIRTIIVEKDDETGTETRSENIECGNIEGLDADAIIAQLRESSELSAERLEEVRERLENLHLGTGSQKVKVVIETDEE